MYAVAQIQPNISIIEWVDLGSHTIQPGPAGLDSLYKILEMYETSLKVFAVRVRGSFSGVGVFDGLAEVSWLDTSDYLESSLGLFLR